MYHLYTFFFVPCILFLQSQLIENSVCLLRNLSYQVHREIPGFERFVEAVPVSQAPASSSQKGSCFSSRKGKGLCYRVVLYVFSQTEEDGTLDQFSYQHM